MTGSLRATHMWGIAVGVVALAYVGLWQWGSYGPFEIVINTPTRTLDEVVVRLSHGIAYEHRSKETYSQTRAGHSNEPIRFPRGFVCLCLRRPSMTVFALHPAFFSFAHTVRESSMRHLGVMRVTTNAVKLWPEAKFTDVRIAPQDADRVLGGLLVIWVRRLENEYVPNAHLPLAAVKPTMDEARQQLESQPVSEEIKTSMRSRLNAIEAQLRERAIP